MKAIYLAMAGCGAAVAAWGASLEGLSGVELARAVKEQYAPAAEVAERPKGEAWFGDGSRAVELAPLSWWGDAAPTDYYNIVDGSAEFVRARQDFVPGEVAEPQSVGEGWTAGIGEVSGMETSLWSPADDRRGDLARRLMYMAVVHPAVLWYGRAAMLYEERWPLLTGYGRRILLQWHREDPVDERELAECEAIALAQGNENPFVKLPELADYLWGENSGQGFIEPDHHDRVPLKAVYSIAVDEYIDLYSPYIPQDAVWQLDGVTVAESVVVSGLSLGRHELSFSCIDHAGSVLITVTQ